MHLPDGFLSAPVWIGADVLAGAAVAYSAYRTARELNERRIPLMGVAGAFVFAAQMVPFRIPIPGASSGHLIGGVLLTALLGPYAATVVMTCILVVQWLLFQDGGLTALGANVINMAILPAAIGGVALSIARQLKPGTGWPYFGAVFSSAWLATVASAAAAGLAIGLSGTAPLGPVLIALSGVHAVIGLGEAVITVAILRFLKSVRADLLEPAADR